MTEQRYLSIRHRGCSATASFFEQAFQTFSIQPLFKAYDMVKELEALVEATQLMSEQL